MSIDQNINQQLRDLGYTDIADALQSLFITTVPRVQTSPLTILFNESNTELPVNGYATDITEPISSFQETSDPIPDPGNFPAPHVYGTSRNENVTDGFNSDAGYYYNAPDHKHKVYGGKPIKGRRYDVSSLQVSQYATLRGHDNDLEILPPRSL